jgi:hypothetical protein
VSPVKYELGFYIPEDGILHSHQSGNLKSLTVSTGVAAAVVPDTFRGQCKKQNDPVLSRLVPSCSETAPRLTRPQAHILVVMQTQPLPFLLHQSAKANMWRGNNTHSWPQFTCECVQLSSASQDRKRFPRFSRMGLLSLWSHEPSPCVQLLLTRTAFHSSPPPPPPPQAEPQFPQRGYITHSHFDKLTPAGGFHATLGNCCGN